MSSEERNENEYVFNWTIKNYSACYHGLGERISSPIFKIDDLYGSRWLLDFYPTGHTDANYVTLYLRWLDSDENIEKISVDYSIEIGSETNVVVKCLSEQNALYEMVNERYGWWQFLAIEELTKEMDKWEEDTLIVRCRIKMNKTKEQTYLASEAFTKINVDRCLVEWDARIPTAFAYSENIFFSLLELHQFEITLTSISESLTISVHPKVCKCEMPVKLTFKITIFDKFGCKLGSKRAVHLFKTVEYWNFPNFITEKQLESCKIDSSLYEFKLTCEAYCSKKSTSDFSRILKFTSPIVPNSNPKVEIALQTEYRRIFNSKKYSNVTIRAGNETFPAHKFVLIVRSPVFAAMFDQDMLENQTGVVDITDMDGKTLYVFLEFLYTETVKDMDYDIAKKLMLAADKYEVPSLLDRCASFLKSIVSVENVCEIITIADLVNCECLKSCALNYIKVNADKILPTVAWTQLIDDNIKLATYILSELSMLIRVECKFK